MSDDQVTRLYVDSALEALDRGWFDGFLPLFEEAIKRRKRLAVTPSRTDKRPPASVLTTSAHSD